MHKGYKMMREAVKQSPSSLLSLPSALQEEVNQMFPYSIGIEVEAFFKENQLAHFFLVNDLKLKFPEIIDVNCDTHEQRFRIPSGIKGLICLEAICNFMKDYMKLNPGSGIHYHIDFSEMKFWSEFLGPDHVIVNNQKWILQSLKSWNYTGHFNNWSVSTIKTAVKFHTLYKTVEVRIGEMTFDYELIVKRILHLQNIAKKLKWNITQREVKRLHLNQLAHKKISKKVKKLQKHTFPF